MEVANIEMPRTKTTHKFAYFNHILGGVGVDFDIYFKRGKEEKAIGFKATPPKTSTMEDRRRNLEIVDKFLSLCDKNQIPVEILIAKIGINSEDINGNPRIIQVSDDDLPRDRLTIHKFNNRAAHTSEIVFFGAYEDHTHREFRYRVHIQAAVLIPNLSEQIKELERR